MLPSSHVDCLLRIGDVATLLRGALTDHPLLQDRVYASLQQNILDGLLPADARLIETELAPALGVSRTPVREAFRRLQQEGLVVVWPRAGVFVGSFSLKEVEDTYTVRSALEGLASALAAVDVERIRAAIDTFHILLNHASRNDRLVDLLVRLNDSIKRFRAVTSSLPDRGEAVIRDHDAILRALEAQDGSCADRLMWEHVDGSRRRLLAHLAETGTVVAHDPAAIPLSLSGTGNDPGSLNAPADRRGTNRPKEERPA